MSRHTLVTGANKGIGRAIVAAIVDADPDHHVFLGTRELDRGESARQALVADNPERDGRIHVLQLDVASETSVKRAAAEVAERLREHDSPLYGIVNNAGIGGSNPMKAILEVNVHGPRRVCDAFIPLLAPDRGRVVNVSSASGPMFVSRCSAVRQQELTDPNITQEKLTSLMQTCLALAESDAEAASAAGFGSLDAYGLSKACLNAYTMLLARTWPTLTINACTPGFIETDMTRRYAEGQDKTPEELGMRPPSAGARAPLHLLLGEVGGSGWFFGSDAQRSPLDRYRSPGDPAFVPED